MMICYLCHEPDATRCQRCSFTYCAAHMKHRNHSCQEASEPNRKRER